MHADRLSFIDNLCKSNLSKLTWNNSVYKTMLSENFWRFHARFWLTIEKLRNQNINSPLNLLTFSMKQGAKLFEYVIIICLIQVQVNIDGVCIKWYEEKQNDMKKNRKVEKRKRALHFSSIDYIVYLLVWGEDVSQVW